ncbi:hypothetical protein GCM10027446_19590 [Angustibacter peucedani]
MSRTTTRTRVTSGAALALAALLVGAGPASAATTSPTTEATTTEATATATATATGDPSSSSSTTSPTGTASPSSSSSTTSPSTTTAPTTAPTTPAHPTTSGGTATTTGVPDGGFARSYGLRAAAGPGTSTDPAEVAGGYLARQLAASGGHFFTEFGGVQYPDYGLTLDAVLALDASGVGQDAASTATQYVADHVRSYISGIDYGGAGERYVGPIAKTLNAAVAQQVDPAAFGGVDLVAELEALEQPSGRFQDTFDPMVSGADYSNTFGQSFAVLGLERAGAGASAQAVAFLELQQCPAGGFRLTEGAAACADDTTADPDSTSLALQALIAAKGTGAASVVKGLTWLAGRQGSDGGFGGGTTTEAENANSTGLAGQALLAGGRTAQARKAVAYVKGLQYGCGFPAALRGGIAYNQDSYDAQDAKNGAATPDDQDRRSTAQAALAVAGTPLGVVTAVGADANAPTLACAASTTTTTSPSTTTSSTGTSAGGSGTGTTSQEAAPAVDPASGELAMTGAEVLPVALTGLGLVLLGTAAVVLARRRTSRGEHA